MAGLGVAPTALAESSPAAAPSPTGREGSTWYAPHPSPLHTPARAFLPAPSDDCFSSLPIACVPSGSSDCLALPFVLPDELALMVSSSLVVFNMTVRARLRCICICSEICICSGHEVILVLPDACSTCYLLRCSVHVHLLTGDPRFTKFLTNPTINKCFCCCAAVLSC